ncbi:hypothetical protein DM860_009187 [Cuscuta australis]|uniref:Uncharacterized protein n=1 Tax=Cuscuta australis TaxID=267555 RepID=A0A328DBW2_9ASTE|nr:hypothetical protein DM860_009187 [Cuscuta australis]
MEYLTRSLLWFASKDKFGYHPRCKALKIINIVFADDLIVVCKAEENTIRCIMKALQHFRGTTGLNINHTKSEVIFGGIDAKVETKLLQIVNMKKGMKFPSPTWGAYHCI